MPKLSYCELLDEDVDERVSGTEKDISVCAPVIQDLTFIDHDLRLLAESFDIRKTPCGRLGDILRCCRIAAISDITFCWFGSSRFLLPVITAKLFRRPVVIVAGGYDVANVPDIPYGNMAKWHSRWLGRAIFKLADVVLAVSQSTQTQAIKEAGVDAGRVRVVYNGVDQATFVRNPSRKNRNNTVLVVANIHGDAYERKNIDYILEVARHLPEMRFAFVGNFDARGARRFLDNAPPNATALGPMAQVKVAELYYSSLIYFQPSLHESFGCAVAEAMLSGCIPIVSNCYALPEVVGNAGILVDPRNVDSAVAAIQQVAECGFVPTEDGRERVKRMFSLEARVKILKSTLSTLATRRPLVDTRR
jgi:glycosyltransferase involved in cell wall biosynthesis